MYKKPLFILIFLGILILINTIKVQSGCVYDLNGTWRTGNIGLFYIRQIDDKIWWYGEDDQLSPTWSNIAYGTVDGNIITLDWIDVPKGYASLRGSLVIEIKYPNRLVRIAETGGFGGGTQWEKVDDGDM